MATVKLKSIRPYFMQKFNPITKGDYLTFTQQDLLYQQQNIKKNDLKMKYLRLFFSQDTDTCWTSPVACQLQNKCNNLIHSPGQTLACLVFG